MGLKHYFPGKPCRRGHVDRRLVKGGKCLTCHKERTKRWKEENPDRERAIRSRAIRKHDPFDFIASRKSAECEKRGIPCDIDGEFLKTLMPVDGLCPITRVKLAFPGDDRPRSERVSIDRIDPNGGYVRGNVALISWRANRLKMDETDPDVFARLASWIRDTKAV